MKQYKYTKSRWVKWLLLTVAVFMLTVVVAGIAGYTVYKNNLKPVSTETTSKIVVIQQGSSADAIAAQLQNEGLVRSAWAFSLYTRLQNLRSSLQAGTYALRPNMSSQDVASVIARGKVDTKLFTILPGQRMIDQIRDNLINAGYSQQEVDEALDAESYAGHPALADKPAGASLEGYLYPESFQLTSNTSAKEIIRASLDEMNNQLTPALKEGFAKQGLTPYQGIILASIIEKEVSNLNDKPQVAQVFLKRLNSGMALGSDVTAVYGAVLAGKPESIFYDSAYNTHKNVGLPPTPISNMSKTSLEAAANPSSTDWLFFVAGDDGVTYFTRTLQEHEAAVEAHCKQLCSAVQ